MTGTILRLPFHNNSFDVVTCCEVLEHLPYDSFSGALSELRRVCRSWAILSLPDSRRKLQFGFRSDRLGYFRAIFHAPRLIDPVHRFDGQHYWEIGKASYPLGRVIDDIESEGFSVRDTYCVPRTHTICSSFLERPAQNDLVWVQDFQREPLSLDYCDMKEDAPGNCDQWHGKLSRDKALFMLENQRYSPDCHQMIGF